jgi:signal transduction histidine kinase
LATQSIAADPGMELRDLLSDREFLDRTNGSNRADNRFEAFEVLASVFVEAPDVVLQRLVDIAVEFCGADSAGISLEEADVHGELRFRWVAVSGSFSKYLNGTTPRFFSPCGTCLSSWRPQHYRVTKPYYDFLGVVAEPITDGLLIPWASDESRGTIWAISHGSPETFHPDDYRLLKTLADFAGISVRLAERAQRTSSLRQLSADLMRVQDEERRRIARELHDSIGQYLAALKMNLGQLKRRSKTVDKQILADSQQLLDQCLSETRTISHLLHPPLLNEMGLRSAAQWYVEGFSERSGIKVLLQIDKGLGRLQEDVETALFRTLQESLNNVHRHSGSKKVEVVIRVEGNKVLTTIRDYGCGFDSQHLREVKNGRGSRGVGLTGLRERIAALGGVFEVTVADPGVLISVTLPLSSPSKD